MFVFMFMFILLALSSFLFPPSILLLLSIFLFPVTPLVCLKVMIAFHLHVFVFFPSGVLKNAG